MSALVSIIIPAYNIEKYIGRCLDSVLCQTYKDLEIIIVDDGSKDNTGNILDEYGKKDSRIKVIHQKNRGVSAARNCGLKEAGGDYIGFVDGDDVIEYNMYEVLVKLIEEEDADIAHCGYQMVFPDHIDYYHNTGMKKIQDKEDGLKDLLEGKIIEPAIYNKIYRRHVIEKIYFDETIRMNEDLLYNYHAFKNSNKSVFYDLPLYHYMIRKGSATSGMKRLKMDQDVITVAKMILNDSPESVKTVVYYRYIYLLMTVSRKSIDDDNYKKYQKKQKIILKNERRTELYRNVIKGKLNFMVILTLYFPFLFTFIYKIYDKMTGVSTKYSVD